jgi:hypothetical protein
MPGRPLAGPALVTVPPDAQAEAAVPAEVGSAVPAGVEG